MITASLAWPTKADARSAFQPVQNVSDRERGRRGGGQRGRGGRAFLAAGHDVGVIMNAWDVYGRQEITEDDIHREMDRLSK